ncbi:MAG: ZIP family metal transporter [Holophaga sp.]|nr:ZIP family metal transporter [Holophaga sp.]
MTLHPLYWLAPIAALATLLGGWLVVRYFQGKSSLMRHLSGVAAGYLVAVTLVRILPESIEQGGNGMAYWALGGFLAVHVIEHGISPHFHYGEETHAHEVTWLAGILALIGLSLHSFMDGMAITAAIRTQSSLGTLVFMGILLHRIPEGATISSIFLVRGFGARGSMLAAGGLALAAWLGAVSQEFLKLPVGPVLGLAAGLGLYVASSDLLPQAQKEKGWKSTLGLLTGTLLFLVTSALVQHNHGH